MQLEHYISTLLFRYQCVVVPEFGAFLSREKGASHHEKSNTFYPPTKQLSFNAQLLTGDGILVSHIATSLFKTYEESLALLEYEVKKWKHHLSQGEEIALEGLGVLNESPDGKIHFKPAQNTNYLRSSFGLTAVKASPRLLEAAEATQAIEKSLEQEAVLFQLDPSKQQAPTFKKHILKYAAAGLIGVSGLLSFYTSYTTHTENRMVAQQEAQQIVNQKIQEATFFSNNPFTLSALEISLPKKKVAAPSFFIIAGAFRDSGNASKKIAQLKKNGFKKAAYLGANRWGLHQVSYAAFNEEQEARAFLSDIQKQYAKDAWLLIRKK